MNKYVDLHTHSTASDGTDTPELLMENAKKAGLSAIALTDHDNLEGLSRAEKRAQELDLELIKGVEISTDHTRGEVHILGYWFHHNPMENKNLTDTFEKLFQFREQRNFELFKKLATVGIHITEEEIRAVMGDEKLMCRPHFALAMLSKGLVPDLRTAFLKYLGIDGCAYVPKAKLDQKEAIELLRNSHALVSLAHPYLMLCSDEKERRNVIKKLKDYGLQGIESLYSVNNEQETMQSLNYAKEFELYNTGGSDYHGKVKPTIFLGKGRGKLKIDYSILETLKNAPV